MLSAVEKVAIANPTSANLSDKVGSEVDVVLKFKIYDQLSWNWQIGRLMPGDAYKLASGKDADNVDAVQGILSYKF
jgi:hypothetical protein